MARSFPKKGATTAAGFTGFRPAAFTFFRGLRDNNDPAWFKPRKAIYETEVLTPFRALIAAVTAALAEAGIPLAGDPARSIFRIYRDVRFSPDKRLYKTHAGAVLTRSGQKHDPGLLYLHLEPGASMVAAGFWHPEPPMLLRLRRAMLSDPARFIEIAKALEAAGSPLSSDETLTRLPRGFESAKGMPVEDYVCWKSFTAHAMLRNKDMQSPEAVDLIVDFARSALPFLEWGWEAIEDDMTPLVMAMPARPLPPPDF